MLVAGEDSQFVRYTGGEAEVERRKGYFGDLSVAALANCGHMLHHDQPEELARLLEAFLAN